MLVLAREFCATLSDILERLPLGKEQAQLLDASPHGPAILAPPDKEHCWDSSFDHRSP